LLLLSGLGFYLIDFSKRWFLLLLASYVFYASWNAWYLALILLTTTLSFWTAIKISSSRRNRSKKLWLYVGVGSCLLLLFIFKYFDFFNAELKSLFNNYGMLYSVPNLELILPIAISFYTFQVVSYLVDVFENKVSVEKNLGKFALYVVFFPQLVAGPIERSTTFLPQIRKLDVKPKFRTFPRLLHRLRHGGRLIFLGVFKKVVIADNLAPFVENVFDKEQSQLGGLIVVALLAFSFQIYMDFSAYTDIARGSARLFGINLMNNFNGPYLSKNIQEFWRNWHISLSTWFRDYVYKRCNRNRTSVVNVLWAILFTFLLSGIWHGANWTFIVWGIYHGLGLCLFLILRKISRSENLPSFIKSGFLMISNPVFSWCVTFTFVVFGWLFFRSPDIGSAIESIYFIAASTFYSFAIPIFELFGINTDQYFGLNLLFFFKKLISSPGGLFAVLGILFIVICDFLKKHGFNMNKIPTKFRWSLYYVGLVTITLSGEFGMQQFIYFQF